MPKDMLNAGSHSGFFPVGLFLFVCEGPVAIPLFVYSQCGLFAAFFFQFTF
jgi:hypothetical protein